MKKVLVLFIIGLVALTACEKEDYGLGECLDQKITDFKNDVNTCSEGADVKEYEFLGKKVYVFNPGICGADFFSEVIDEDCNSLGNLGGIAGNSVISGTDFSEAVYKRVIWRR